MNSQFWGKLIFNPTIPIKGQNKDISNMTPQKFTSHLPLMMEDIVHQNKIANQHWGKCKDQIWERRHFPWTMVEGSSGAITVQLDLEAIYSRLEQEDGGTSQCV